MTTRPTRIVAAPIMPPQTFCDVTPFSLPADTACLTEKSDAAPARLLLPPGLILPTTVKRSLWVFRTPKLELLKD